MTQPSFYSGANYTRQMLAASWGEPEAACTVDRYN